MLVNFVIMQNSPIVVMNHLASFYVCIGMHWCVEALNHTSLDPFAQRNVYVASNTRDFVLQSKNDKEHVW